MIQIICIYCDKDMGEKDGKGVTGISHGICETCFLIEMEKTENEFRKQNIKQG